MHPSDSTRRLTRIGRIRQFESQPYQASQHDLLCSSSDFLLWACFCLSYWGNFMPDGQRVTSAHGILEVASVLSENFKSKAQELFSSLDSENMPSLFWHDFGGGTGFTSLSLFYHLSESLGKYYPIEIDEKMPGAQVLLWDVECALSFHSQNWNKAHWWEGAVCITAFEEMPEMCDFDLFPGLGRAEIQYREQGCCTNMSANAWQVPIMHEWYGQVRELIMKEYVAWSAGLLCFICVARNQIAFVLALSWKEHYQSDLWSSNLNCGDRLSAGD